MKNKHILITGASSGLGYATLCAALGKDYNVTALDLHVTNLDPHPKLKTYECDIANETQMTSVFNNIEDLDAVVHCAGIAPASKIFSAKKGPHDSALFSKTLEVNLLGSFLILKLSAAKMIQTKHSAHDRVIILTSSIAAYEGQMGQVAYAASKGGVSGMVLPAARELSAHGIRVVGIAPGVFQTAMVAGFSQEIQDNLAQQIPIGRLGQPEEYAHLAFSIIDNPYINGDTIRLDGALRMT